MLKLPAILLLVVLSILGGGGYYLANKSVHCSQDPPIAIPRTNNNNNENNNESHLSLFFVNSCDVYSSTYNEAREKFIAAASKHSNIELHSIPIYKDLTTDIAIIPGNTPEYIVHSSGVHGPEGYAGSAIQIAFLSSLSVLPYFDDDNNNNDKIKKPRPTIVLVHAVNPYGMKYYRRPNENNVDLNRNALSDFHYVLHERDENIAGYNDFQYLISPKYAPSAYDMTIGWFITAVTTILKHGFAPLKRVVVAGQYHDPKGIGYGGNELQPSIKNLQEFLLQQNIMKDVLVWIDTHTGLGKSGMDSLEIKDFSYQEAKDFFPTAASIITSDIEDKQALSGYELTIGIIYRYMKDLAYSTSGSNCNDKKLFVLQEFGTIPSTLVGRCIMLENAIYHFGGKFDETNNNNNNATDYQRQELSKIAFYPQATKWRENIVQRGIHLILSALDNWETLKIKSSNDEKNNGNSNEDEKEKDEADHKVEFEKQQKDDDIAENDNENQNMQEQPVENADQKSVNEGEL